MHWTIKKYRLGWLLAVALLCMAGAGHAQFSRFGKNKVQYDEFDWEKMETPHFDVYFYQEEEELAGYAAHMAEEKFLDLERKFGHTVQRRVPLIVYSSHVYFEQTNILPNFLPEGVAGFTEFLKGRVAMPMNGSLPEFERVLHHELVHVFMFDRVRRVLQRHGINEFRPGPLWFSEGIAEYWSSHWDSYADMTIRDALFADRLVPIAQMYMIRGTFHMYKEGQSICIFMAQRYGEDVFGLMFDNWWRAETFAKIFELTTGEPLSKLDKEWQYHLRKQYLPDIGGSDPPGQLARAVTKVGFNLKPQIIQGEDEAVDLVFFRNHDGFTHIARVALEGGEPEVLVGGEALPMFESLHPLSTKLAISADNRWLAFAAKQRGRDHLIIWDLERDKITENRVFDEIVAITAPTWSPDGLALVFSGANKGGLVDLYRMDRGSGDIEALTNDIYNDRDPDWSPDGRYIVFSSDRFAEGRQGFTNLFLYDLQQERVEILTQGLYRDVQPDWSPDGLRIAFCSDRDTMYNLYITRLPKAGQPAPIERVTRVLTGAFDPVWRPTGGLVFTGFEGGGFQLYDLELELEEEEEEKPVTTDSSVVPAAADGPVLAVEDTASAWKLEGLYSRDRFPRRKYKSKYSLDIAQSQIAQDPEFGTSGGIQVALSDVLGNEQFFFVLSHIAGSNSGFFDGLNIALGRSNLERQVNLNWGVFRLNDRFTSRFGRFVREKRTGGYLEVNYPFSTFNRLDTRISVRQSEIDRQFEGRQLDGWLMTNIVSYTYDSSRWIPTGPLDGTRYSVGISQTVDFKSSRRFNSTVFGDYRHYFRFTRRSALALRYMARHSRGEVPEFFSLGGSWTLRGYPWRSIWGRNLVLINHELRFPLVDQLVLGLPFGRIDFSAFRGALLVDAGNAWNDSFGEWRGSIGGGVRLALGGVFVFRLDRVRRTNFKSIENKSRWDFFFGWDF
jgi:hypothetical protein